MILWAFVCHGIVVTHVASELALAPDNWQGSCDHVVRGTNEDGISEDVVSFELCGKFELFDLEYEALGVTVIGGWPIDGIDRDFHFLRRQVPHFLDGFLAVVLLWPTPDTLDDRVLR
jgi:hypothetical protein